MTMTVRDTPRSGTVPAASHPLLGRNQRLEPRTGYATAARWRTYQRKRPRSRAAREDSQFLYEGLPYSPQTVSQRRGCDGGA
ncbi:hypothetical protein TRAPUB_9851 [Trametes pubescens]|uniref:Uncharacterized protein n=1 Tax=Trametes pubescens TaxID=154538 RepID=A0A1M2W1E5_TRAPU|nr:hypothetical protein TRAPUB_9851 [Trametes pubescens]